MGAVAPMIDNAKLKNIASDILTIMESREFTTGWMGPAGHVRDISTGIDNTAADQAQAGMKKIATAAAFFANANTDLGTASTWIRESFRPMARMMALVDLCSPENAEYMNSDTELGKLRGEYLLRHVDTEKAKAFLDAVVRARDEGKITIKGKYADVITKAIEFYDLAQQKLEVVAGGRGLGSAAASNARPLSRAVPDRILPNKPAEPPREAAN